MLVNTLYFHTVRLALLGFAVHSGAVLWIAGEELSLTNRACWGVNALVNLFGLLLHRKLTNYLDLEDIEVLMDDAERNGYVDRWVQYGRICFLRHLGAWVSANGVFALLLVADDKEAVPDKLRTLLPLGLYGSVIPGLALGFGSMNTVGLLISLVAGGLGLSVDNYAVTFVTRTNPRTQRRTASGSNLGNSWESAVQAWNTLNALTRHICARIEILFILYFCVFGFLCATCVILPLGVFGDPTESTWPFVGGMLVCITFAVFVLNKAASVSNKCDRIPAVVNQVKGRQGSRLYVGGSPSL